jgi:hypothetical protein
MYSFRMQARMLLSDPVYLLGLQAPRTIRYGKFYPLTIF